MDKNFPLVFFLSRGFLLGMVYSLTFSLTASDTIISTLIGSIIGSILIYLFHKIDINKRKYILFISSLSFIALIILILENFIHSYFLTQTPLFITIIPTILLAFYLASKTFNVIKRSGKIIWFISLVIANFTVISLTKYINLSNMLPLFTHKISTIFSSSMIYAIYTSFPNILLTSNIDTKKHVLYYFITSINSILVCLLVLSALTPQIAQMYSFPEYMVLKRIRIFEFIENVENILASIWYFDLLYLLALSIKTLNSIASKKITILLTTIITIIITMVISKNYYLVLYLYHNTIYIFTSLMILLFIPRKKS